MFTALSFSFPLPGERQAFLVWREPLAGARSFDVFRTPGGKRNDEPLRDENDNGQIGFLEAELDADRDYAYRVVTRGAEDGSATIVARADDANEGEQRGGAVSSRFAPTDLASRASTRRRSSVCPTCSSSRSSSARPTASASACARRGSR